MKRRLAFSAAAVAMGAVVAAAPSASAATYQWSGYGGYTRTGHIECTQAPPRTITRTFNFFYPPRTITITIPGRLICTYVRT